MSQTTGEETDKYIVRALDDLAEARSTCGFRRAVITGEDSDAISLSVLRINDSTKHYHLKATEVYFVLEGEGALELDDEVVPLRAGTTVLIKPGVRHTAKGEVTAVIMGVPPFAKDDMFFD